jgi:hypothetical protein
LRSIWIFRKNIRFAVRLSTLELPLSAPRSETSQEVTVGADMNDFTGSHSARFNTESSLLGSDNRYDYKDDSQYPMLLNGEVVNPLWGISKAGRARKRLPQACL